MVIRPISILLALLAAPAFARPPHNESPPAALDVAAESVDRAGLLPADAALLDRPEFGWRHLQTDHFVLHHDQKIFAAKVARMGEEFYEAISADLPELRDRIAPRRSHVFVFRDPDDWAAIVAGAPDVDSWAASFVRGNAMYLQETGTAPADKMGTLAHEMAHLVFRRFIPVHLPLWLDEGLAEYYGEFAYRDARGLGQNRRSAFRSLKNRTPLAELLGATDYPEDPKDVADFYATAKHLVGFLRLRFPAEKWNAFFGSLLAGRSGADALLAAYGWADLAELDKEFARFGR
ncbi:MAG: hypothetical protein AB7V14_11050 [Kiritimatiellia bacterium]